MTKLSEKIEKFTAAAAALREAAKDLDREVEAELASRVTVDDLQELVNKLPKGYQNARRIYEKIIRIEDAAG